MEIAVLGGCGYLGGAICQELKNRGEQVTSYDNKIYREEDSPCCNIEFDILNDHKDVKYLRDYDKIIWSIDIDVEDFYIQTESEIYIKRNLKIFKAMLKEYGDKIILISDDYLGDNITYKKFLKDKEFLCIKHKAKYFKLPSLYGPSPSMRFDTLLNELFITAYINGGMMMDDWLKRIPILNVLLAGRYIANELDKKEQPKKICGYYLSIIEYAHIINICFGSKLDIICKGTFNLYSENNDFDYDYEIDADLSIESSVNYMLKGIERGDIEDIMKDNYSNKKLIENAFSSNKLNKFIRELK